MLHDLNSGSKDMVIKKEMDIKKKADDHLFESFLLYFCMKLL